MADEKDNPFASKDTGTSGVVGLLGNIGMYLLVLAICATGGYLAGAPLRKVQGGVDASQQDMQAQPQQGEQTLATKDQTAAKPVGKTKMIPMKDVITVSLKGARGNRHLRCKLSLEVREEDHKGASTLMDEKTTVLKSWLLMYFNGKTVQDLAGNENMHRVAREVADAFNEELWPNESGQILKVYFEEWLTN